MKNGFRRIVIKIGSSLFCSSGNRLDPAILGGIVRKQLVRLADDGAQICVVSSGAIALGMNILKLSERPQKLAELQAAAAVGQNALMNAFQKAMRGGYHCAQLLLTWEDFTDRQRWLNARNTLSTLMGGAYAGKKIIPVINENDTVSTNEIRFGDNDQLSARVACLISADILIILSDIDGLYGKDKVTIPVVEKITPAIRALAAPTDKKTCVGGMVTKIDAAKIASHAGIPCVIANGRRPGSIIEAVNEPENAGTLFRPDIKGLGERERWIAFGTRAKGTVVVDDGAKKALCDNKSLLCVGVTGCQGNFASGDIVAIVDKNGLKFATGMSGVDSRELDAIKGSHHVREIIHKDNIVII